MRIWIWINEWQNKQNIGYRKQIEFTKIKQDNLCSLSQFEWNDIQLAYDLWCGKYEFDFKLYLSFIEWIL